MSTGVLSRVSIWHYLMISGQHEQEVERFEMGERIRAIGQSTDGVIWLLEDGRPPQFGKGWKQGGGRLLKLTAATEQKR
jgi:hypothetical protein